MIKTANWEGWSEAMISQFQKDFLAWYQTEKRNLPWRINTEPYRIWISEIMLQQTRVDTVIDYYYRFMEWFPTIEDLANASEERLLKAWEGLGYYSRARNLQAAAKQIMSDYQGEMPSSVEEIRHLKGIGPYTTGAIASIAFNLPEPAIDGNVMRVVSRLFCIEADIAKPKSRLYFDEVMRKIISQQQPGDFNQAMMDLGSAICTPKNPKCEECPINGYCLAYSENRQEGLPVKTKKLKPKDVYYVAGIIENSSKEILLVQRKSQGLLANFWTFPMEEVTKAVFDELKFKWAKEESSQLELLFVAESEEPAVFTDLPVVWQKKHYSEVQHVFSHLRWHVLPFYGRADNSLSFYQRQKWLKTQAFSELAFPKIQHKLIESWQKN